MRLSCCAYSYRDALKAGTLSMEEFVRTAREMGCDGVELTSYYFPSTDRAYLNSLKRHVHREGLSVSGTAIGTDFAQPDAGKRQEHVRLTREWIENSVVLGAPTLRVFAGPVREGSPEADAFRWVVECLQEAATHAAEAGITLALENHGGVTSNADQALRLVKAVDSEWLGLNLDFGNFSGEIYAQFAQCAPHAVATHAKVYYAVDPGTKRQAAVDYAKVREIMDASGYRGYLAIEYEEADDPATAVPAFAADLLNVLRN